MTAKKPDHTPPSSAPAAQARRLSLRDAKFRAEVFSLGQPTLIVFLAFLNAFVPLSIDLYLPALPSMARFFEASESSAKLTLSLFMIFFGLSMLFWGPFSDKFGRKKILRLGLCLYIAGSLWCAAALFSAYRASAE